MNERIEEGRGMERWKRREGKIGRREYWDEREIGRGEEYK